MDSRGSGSGKDNRLLTGWRAIADHFGRDESTVKRWVAQRAMPVHRLPGGRRSAVYADPDELDAWLKGTATAATAAMPAPASLGADTTPQAGRSWPVAVAVLMGVGLAGMAAWWLSKPVETDKVVAAYTPLPEAHELYPQGTYLWDRRTPKSLRQAAELFTRAAEIDPNYAGAYAGLANTYNLLREYSPMPPQEAYAAAAEAAEKAIALDPNDADAQSALAFAEFYGFRRLKDGIARFELARDLDPNSAKIRQWFANALLHLGRFDEALAEIGEAQRLDPASRSILASKGLALFCAGRTEEAVRLLNEIAAIEPDFLSPHTYLTYVHLARGDYPAYLRELRIVGELREDPSRIAVAEAGRAGFEADGFAGMVEAMLAEERRQLAAGKTIIYNIARLEALAGDWRAAVEDLRASLAAGEEHVMALNIDPAFRLIRTNAEFRRFAAGFGLPIVP